MSRIETESIISFNDEEDFAQISTRQQRMKTRMRKLGIEEHYRQADYVCYRVPKSWIKVSPPRKVSETQRAAARENIKIAQKSSKSLRATKGNGKNSTRVGGR